MNGSIYGTLAVINLNWSSRVFVGELPLELQKLRKEERNSRFVIVFEQMIPLRSHPVAPG